MIQPNQAGTTKLIVILLLLRTPLPVQAHPLPTAQLATISTHLLAVTCTTAENNPEIKNLSEKTATTLSKLPKVHLKKAPRLDSFKKEQASELLRASTQMGLGILLIGSIGYLIGGKAALSAATFMGPLISATLVKPLGNIGSKLCTLFTPYLASPSIRKALHFKKCHEQRKHKLTKSMNQFLYSTIGKYTNWVETFEVENKECEKAVEEILQFPLGPKRIDPDLTPITEFIKNYPEEVRVAIGDFVVSAITDSKVESLNKKAVPLMFVGPPGTGKTHLASQLGKLLGLPIQIIDIAKYKSVNGNNFWSMGAETGITVDILLGEKTKKGNFSNKIIVLDEIDKALAKDENGRFVHESGAEIMSLLHTLLETQETTTRIFRYAGATYDISHLKIILIGNRTFGEVLGQANAAALESRVNLVKFSGFQDEQKLTLAREHITKVCAARSIAYASIDQQVVEEIVKADTAAGNQGIRMMLQIIDQYVRILEKGALISQVAGVPPVTFDIKKAYANAEPA